MAVDVILKDISIRFRKQHGYATGLKETVLRALSNPQWYKTRPPKKTEFWGLRHINLELSRGDRLGIVGHNGAGKSTLLKIISRIYKPTEGKLSVRGRLAPLIEIGAGFNPELSGRENTYLNSSILGIPRKVIRERMDSIIEFSELNDYFDMPVKYYSTGMLLRLGFSVATEISPDILILDELFAGGGQGFYKKSQQTAGKIYRTGSYFCAGFS